MSGNWNRLLAGLGAICVVAAAGVSTATAAGTRDITARAASAAPVLKVESVSISVNGSSVKHSVLVNGSGHAVYLLTGDSAKHPECTSSNCLSDWPAVTTKAKKLTLGKGVKGKVAIWHHNGMNQVTVSGHPLYTYAGDSSAGVANGQDQKDFGGTWEVLSPSGAAASLSSSKSGSGSGSGSGW